MCTEYLHTFSLIWIMNIMNIWFCNFIDLKNKHKNENSKRSCFYVIWIHLLVVVKFEIILESILNMLLKREILYKLVNMAILIWRQIKSIRSKCWRNRNIVDVKLPEICIPEFCGYYQELGFESYNRCSVFKGGKWKQKP